MTSYSRFLAVAVLATLTTSIGCASDGRGPAARPGDSAAEAARLVRLLENPDTRDAAACRLVALGRYRSKPSYKEPVCGEYYDTVNHVVTAPRMYAVFWVAKYAPDKYKRGEPQGPVTLFDADGYIVPFFQNANLLDEDAEVLAYAGDDRLAMAQVITNSGGEDDKEWNADMLHVVPIAPGQQSILSVIFGPAIHGDFEERCKGFYWGWRQRDVDADGVPEIEIGPLLDAKDIHNITPRAVYRWSKKTARYEGPSGSIAEGFLRVEDKVSSQSCGCGKFHEQVERFALGQQRLAIPVDQTAIRRTRCESFTIEGGSIP